MPIINNLSYVLFLLFSTTVALPWKSMLRSVLLDWISLSRLFGKKRQNANWAQKGHCFASSLAVKIHKNPHFVPSDSSFFRHCSNLSSYAIFIDRPDPLSRRRRNARYDRNIAPYCKILPQRARIMKLQHLRFCFWLILRFQCSIVNCKIS